MDRHRLIGKKEIPRSRRKRLYGLTDAILSNVTVYLNPQIESEKNLSVEEAALFDVVNRAFNRRDS